MAVNPAADINAQLVNLVALLGSDGVYKVAKTDAESPVRALISPVDKNDSVLIQSYGVNGTRLTFQQSAFAARPAKFDSFTCLGKKFVFDGVVDIIVNNVVIGYTVYCKGILG